MQKWPIKGSLYVNAPWPKIQLHFVTFLNRTFYEVYQYNWPPMYFPGTLQSPLLCVSVEKVWPDYKAVAFCLGKALLIPSLGRTEPDYCIGGSSALLL